MLTTTENARHPSRRQISQLRAEAATAGDHDTVALCDLADDGVIDIDAHPHISQRLASRLIAGQIDRSDASLLLLEHIDAARAMGEVRS